jgi:drug/metabolite transporter (DMT)-like permease
VEWSMLAVISALWGSSFLFMEIGLESFQPGVITMARLALGAAALVLVPRARRSIARSDLPRVVMLGVIWMGVPLILFPIAQQWIDSSVAGMINGAMPLFTVAWAVLLLRRLPRPVHLVGLAIGFAGIAAICWPELQVSQASAVGVALLVVAVMFYGLAANIAVPLQQRYGALPVLLRAQLAALVIVIPFGLWSLPGSSWSWRSALAMLPLGVLGTGVAFVLMATLVGRVGGPRGSVAIYFVPVVAIFLGTLVLGERLSAAAVVGTALVLVGAWLTARKERAPEIVASAVSPR